MKQTFNGVVKREKRNQGSKSAHTAIVVETKEHGSLKLRTPGGNPFTSTEFIPFVGEIINVTGEVKGKSIFVDDIKRDVIVTPPPPEPRHTILRPSEDGKKYKL